MRIGRCVSHDDKHACRGGFFSWPAYSFSRTLAQFRWPATLATVLLLTASLTSFAQNNAVPARITAQINESNLTTLRGNTHPLARPQYDQGAVADGMPMHRMLLLLQRSPQQEAALRSLIDQQQSKASPSYHQWLTPQQFGQQYGPAAADIQTVTAWLQSHGFQIARVSTAGTLIEFSGTAGQVRNAFHTEIHRYLVNGAEHFANSTDPQIPAALAPVVAGPVSLHNFPKKPQLRKAGVFTKNVKTGKVVPQDTYSCTNPAGTAVTCNALGPGDFATIYNVAPLWNPGISGHVIDGTGQTIAIVGDSEICTANSPDFGTTYIDPIQTSQLFGTSVTCSSDDVATFRKLFGLPATSPNVIVDGSDPGFNGDEIEADLDVEWSGAIAKGATIDLVIAEDTEATFGTDLAAEYVVDNNLASVLSESFGACEASLGTGGNIFEATLWEQAAAQGITVVVSAGDTGSAGCDDNNSETYAGENPNLVFGPAVNGLASTPFNVAVGGTDFDITAASYQATYWGTTSTTLDGVPDVTALKYIPETTWNNSCAQNFTGATTGCTPTSEEVEFLQAIVAGGGGQSNCAAEDEEDNCYYYPKPSWQTVASGSGLTTANDLTRDVPDVSFLASDGFVSNSFYIVCEADSGQTYSQCNLNTNTANFDFIAVGGTSAAAPSFAGIMAMVDQNMTVNNPSVSGRQGNADYVLYNLAAAQTRSAINCNSSSTSISSSCTFNDITKGNNSVPCQAVSEDGEILRFGCSVDILGSYGVEETVNVNTGAPTATPDNIAWNTAAGLDLATGLGSVNAFNLVTNWPTAGPFTATTPTLCLSLVETTLASCSGPISITHGTQVYVNVTVNGTVSGAPIPVTEVSPPNPPANGSFIDPLAPSVTEDVSLIGTFPTGNPNCIAGCNTGAVDLFTSNNYTLSNADIYPLTSGTTVGQNYSTTYLVGGTYNVAAHYSGDGTYGSSTSSNSISVTVNPEASTAIPCIMVLSLATGEPVNDEGVSLLPYSCTAATTAYYGDLVFIRADVFGSSSGQENATGNVVFYDNAVQGIPIPRGVTTSLYTLNTEGYTEDQTAFLTVGSHSFAAKFTGDASYLTMPSPSGALSFNVVAAPTTTQITSPTNGFTVATATPVTVTAFVDTYSTGNPTGGSLGNAPTGTVNFISSLTGNPINPTPIAVTPTTDNYGFAAATATYSFTPSAKLTVTAVYSPALVNSNANYVTSTSTGVLINVGTAGVNVAPGCGSSTITISAPGGSGTCLFTVAGQNSFAGTVALATQISGGPAGATDNPSCSFGAPDSNFTAPGTITLTTSSETGSATMTCTSTAASALFGPANRPSRRDWPLAGAALSVVCFLILLSLPKERRWKLIPLAILLVVVATAGVSCGGSSSGSTGPTNPGTTIGTYSFTVTVTPQGGTAQTIPISVVVN